MNGRDRKGGNMQQIAEKIGRLFPEELRPKWERAMRLGGRLQEIRLRAGQPAMLYLEDGEWFLGKTGDLTREIGRADRPGREELSAILKNICRYSFYAYEEEMGRGYVTAAGGFRIGLAGEVVTGPDGAIRNIRYVSSLNIRIAREVKGAALGVLPWLYRGQRLYNTLIVSPPGCGKTTLLRDLIRLVSDGSPLAAGQTVGVVDERSEIAGCFQGVPAKDVGMRTDVLDGCPKAQGMMMLLRSMAPRVIAVDELGSLEDVYALEQVIGCGCSVLATLHASSYEEALQKPFLESLLREKAFERFLILPGKGGRFGVGRVIDEEGAVLGENV